MNDYARQSPQPIITGHSDWHQPSSPPQENIVAARQYVADVMSRLNEDPQLRQNVEPSGTFSKCGGEWVRRGGVIRGLEVRGLSRLGHDGRPWLKETEPHRQEGYPRILAPEGFGSGSLDVAATVLARDCEFDACYDFKDGEKQVSGLVCGKVEIIRVDLVIGQPTGPDGAAELKVFEAKELTGLTFSKIGASMVHQKFIAEVTAHAVRCYISKVMSLRVAPLLADVLRAITYPKFDDA